MVRIHRLTIAKRIRVALLAPLLFAVVVPTIAATASAAAVECGGTAHTNPFGDVEYRVLAGPAEQAHHDNIWNRHAYDLIGPPGADIVAGCDGTVEFAGADTSGWGTTVVVRDASTGRCWMYAHLDDVSVVAGDPVQAGTVVGTQGSSGLAQQDHLHISLHYCYPPNRVRAGWAVTWTLLDAPTPTLTPPPSPTAAPTVTPTPTAAPTATPTPSPTAAPTATPTPSPTAGPTPVECGGAQHTNPFGNATYTVLGAPGERPGHDDIWNGRAYDLVGPPGAEVVATCVGQVEFAGFDTSGWGNTVVVRDASTNRCWLYAHLGSIAVSVGDVVLAGTMLGTQGTSGLAQQDHLHLSLHYCYPPNTVQAGYAVAWTLIDAPTLPPPPTNTNPPSDDCGGTNHSNPYGDVEYIIVQRPGGAYSHSNQWNRHAFDLIAPAGSEIVATCDGIVEYAAMDFSGWGNAVVIRDLSNDRCWLYGHFDEMAVSVGDTVRAGTVLGTQGNTGNSLRPHLHLSLHTCQASRWIRTGPTVPWTLEGQS